MRTALAVLLAVSLAAPAWAKPSHADLKKARAHFKSGQKLHDKGRLDEAIAEYQAAYQLSGLPDMLYNLGQVHRMRGNRRAAIDYYTRYLAADPSGRGAAKARSFLDALTREMKAEELAMRGSISEEWRGVVQGASPEPYIPPLPAPGTAPTSAPDERPLITRDGGRNLRLAGLATAGGGVLILAGGAYFGLRARSLSNDLDDLMAGDTYDPGVVDDGRAAQRNAVILLGVGTVAVVTGGVLYFLGMRRSAEPVLTVVPSEGGGVVGLSGRF
jgi:tetratricopeptide (TPR) repeat protein